MPFEVWVNGAEQPRGLGAWPRRCRWTCAPTTRRGCKLKLDALATVADERAFEMPFPPHGEKRLFPGVVAATAAVIRWRCEQLGALQEGGHDAGARRHVQPRGAAHRHRRARWPGRWTSPTRPPARTSRHAEGNAAARADGGTITRPYAIGFSGNYPRALDGLARLLSLDMRVIDPAWIGMKLRKLLNYAEPLGHFMAFVPGERRQQTWPSTVAYLARLMIHRYAMLGVLDEQGFPLREMGILEAPARKARRRSHAPMAGAPCPECGNTTLIHKDGCDFCTACGYVGVCG